MKFVDTHAHLSMLEHCSAGEALSRAQIAGVSRVITVSTEPENWEANQKLAEGFPEVTYSLGLHPHEAGKWEGCRAELQARFSGAVVPPKCVAIGEIGLDFHYNFCPQGVQIRALEEQLQLAKAVNLPVILHCRDAFPALFDVIAKVGLGVRSGVLHCFTGTLDEAEAARRLGLKVSFSGILTFKNAVELRKVASVLSLADLMIETDCPYLAPIPHRGKANEPAFVVHTALELASIKSLTLEEIAQQTTQNAIEFFQIPV